MPISRIEAPRWHFSFDDGGFHRFRPGTRGLVNEEGHRRNFTWAVATLTLGLQDRKNVSIKSDCCSRRSGVALTKRSDREEEQAAKCNAD